MRRRTVSENRAISQMIDQLRMQGLEEERATAAAFRMFRDGELDIKIQNMRAVPAKTEQEVSRIKASILAAEALRRKRKRQKLLRERARKLAAKNNPESPQK